ncbi:hypothetical protein LSAT2_028307 [Lamellibrachia satsuma]|nr:hypothetical protein LSAT2_028307 [Lamellibrachia satsuma]
MSLLSRSRSSSVSTVLTRTGPDRKSPYSRSNVRPDVEDVRMSLEVVIRVQAPYSTLRLRHLASSSWSRECESGWQLNENTRQCMLCPQGFYKNKVDNVYCQQCPRHLVTPGLGSTEASDCSQGNCTAGHRIVGKTCKKCPLGAYQDKKWQTECISCGPRMTTAREGATAEEECFSTDSCFNGHNLCTAAGSGGTCTLVGDGPQYTCGCRSGWETVSENKCEHKCDRGYCLNGGTCNSDSPEHPVCFCADGYKGDRCSTSIPGYTKPTGGSQSILYMIGGGVGGVVLLLVILGVCYVVRYDFVG